MKKQCSPERLKRGSHGLFYKEATDWEKVPEHKRHSYATQMKNSPRLKEDGSEIRIIDDSNTSLMLYMRPLALNSSALSEESEEKKGTPVTIGRSGRIPILGSISEKTEFALSPTKFKNNQSQKMTFPNEERYLLS